MIARPSVAGDLRRRSRIAREQHEDGDQDHRRDDLGIDQVGAGYGLAINLDRFDLA